MPDSEDKNNQLAKKLVEINLEERRQLQYCSLKKWDAGLLTGIEAIEEILIHEKIIRIDMETLRRARGQVHRQQDGKNNPPDKR